MKIIRASFLLILILLIIPLLPYFFQNITFLLSTQSIEYVIQGRWDLVTLYIIIFSAFLLFLVIPFKKGSWKKSNLIYIAFIIALFTEMFGFPLTIYLLSAFINLPEIYSAPAIAFTFEFLGFQFCLLLTSLIAGIVTVIALIFIVLGWKEVYKVRNRDKLVTWGIYKYVRHPQYFGILLITLVWLLAWPTLLTFIMWPILIFAYYKLAKNEEKKLERRFGKKYLEYKNKVGMFLPFP